MIKVLLVDDHDLFRAGLRRILEFEQDIEVAGEAATAGEAYTLAAQLKPDVILLDINLPDETGIEAARKLVGITPSSYILGLTIHDDPEYLLGLMTAGASGYLVKDATPSMLVNAVLTVAAGGVVLDRDLANRTLTREGVAVAGEPDNPGLSDRELEVLSLVAKGMDNASIGDKLFISEKTVKNHMSSILRKLDCADRTQAVIEAARRHLVAIK